MKDERIVVLCDQCRCYLKFWRLTGRKEYAQRALVCLRKATEIYKRMNDITVIMEAA